MAVSFTRISYWIWGGKDQEVPAPGLNSSTDFPYREHDSLKFKSGVGARMRSSSRRKWQSREERRIDKEYDIVIVPSDGGCMSGSESDDSDWSIGWMEPHAADFLSDSESESSFAVLVPCYGRGRGDMREVPKNHVLGAAAVELHDGFSTVLIVAVPLTGKRGVERREEWMGRGACAWGEERQPRCGGEGSSGNPNPRSVQASKDEPHGGAHARREDPQPRRRGREFEKS